MGFNPLDHKGMPLDKQLRSTKEMVSEPYDARDIEPYAHCRIIAMNGIEVESIMFSHNFNRRIDLPEVKQKLAEGRRIEQQQQQRAVNWLIPATESTLEITIGYEQLAVDLTAWIARCEPDPYLTQVYEFGLLEDFDHLYRYAKSLRTARGQKADAVVQQLTEVMPGRPTTQHHRHPDNSIRKHYNKHTADPLSRLHALTITSAEQQTMNFYMNIGNRFLEPAARQLYAEIGMIEEQRATSCVATTDASRQKCFLPSFRTY